MKKISFWKGVLSWVKLSMIMFMAMFIILALPYLGLDEFNLTWRLLAIKLVIILTGIVYITGVFSYGGIKLKRRGFLVTGAGHFFLTAFFALFLYPVVGFAIAIFYTAAAYKLATSKIIDCKEASSPGGQV